MSIRAVRLRFGTAIAASTTAQAGIGNLTINPGGQIQIEALTNINTTAGQKVDARSTPAAPAQVQLNAAFDPSSILTSASNGVLLLNTATFGTQLNLSTIGAGNFQLAAGLATTYSASQLLVGSNGTWVVGGNNANFTFTSTNTNVLSGSGLLQIGSLAFGGGTVTMNTSNSYTGGTVIARGTGLLWNPSTAGNTPLGTGAVDVFGTATATGANGVFSQNSFVIHPGATRGDQRFHCQCRRPLAQWHVAHTRWRDSELHGR